MDRRSWLMLLALSALWGASYLFIKLALEDLSVAMVVFGRTILAAAVLVPIALARGVLGRLRRRGGEVAGLALVQVAGPFLLITVGEKTISSGLAGILVASAPIFTALLALRLDRRERANPVSLLGIAVGMLGVAVLLGVDVGGEEGALLGAALVLVAGLGYAVSGFWLKRRFSDVPPVALAAGTMSASALALAPFALATAPTAVPGLGASAAVLALGVGGTGLAFLIFYTLIAGVGPARASIVAYIAPGFAVSYGGLLLGERVTGVTVGGLVLIVAGSWLAAEGRLPGLGRPGRTRRGSGDAHGRGRDARPGGLPGVAAAPTDPATVGATAPDARAAGAAAPDPSAAGARRTRR